MEEGAGKYAESNTYASSTSEEKRARKSHDGKGGERKRCTARRHVGKEQTRMMASAREDKFNLKSKKTKNRMIKRAPHVKIITEII